MRMERAKNIKRLGDGKAWIIPTVQQSLTEDDPRAAPNSHKLYKLKDRFPIQIDLESSDIKEICYRRLLGKSPAGETELGNLFDAQGQALRHNTKLLDAKYYDADFSKESFTCIHPFLPAHFDILLHLLGALANSELDDLANEIYRCHRIAELHRNEPDQAVKDYCTGQLDRAAKLATELQSKIKQTLQARSFVFRGQATAVSALDADLLEAAKKLLSDAADQVFDRYVEAPVRAGTDTAEKLLKVANPAAISSALDPFGLVQTVAGRASSKTDRKAMISILDYIDKRGTVDGKRLLDDFSSDPFGCSPDTTRHIVAAMLTAGEIKLKVSGREVTAADQQAIDTLKTNNSFKQIGVALRDERPSIETLGRAAERLTELVGDMVIPLGQEISKTAVKHFPRFQHDCGSLAEKISGLRLAGSDRVRTLNQDIADVLFTDASDAPQRLGAETSAIYDNLKWALEVKRVLDNGLDVTLRDLQAHRRDIESLPDTGVPGTRPGGSQS